MARTSTQTIRKLKGQRPIVCSTAYDFFTASLADKAGVDLILVGDSVGTTMLGYESTVPVTLDMIVHHTAAVARAKPEALLVADLPFGVASQSFDKLMEACMRLVQEAGAQAVKLEGGVAFAPVIKRLVEAGVPVVGHIGLLPQRVYELGGYRRFGKTDEERAALLDDARAVQEAGAFAIVCEMVNHSLASEISRELRVPLIGIGAGAECDGQILVITDILGMTLGNYPSFAKQYAQLGKIGLEAMQAYVADVQEHRFPEQDKPKS